MANQPHILLIEDDVRLCRLIKDYLCLLYTSRCV